MVTIRGGAAPSTAWAFFTISGPLLVSSLRSNPLENLPVRYYFDVEFPHDRENTLLTLLSSVCIFTHDE